MSTEEQAMIAIGMGLAWLSYATGLWGYCLIRGYDISPKQIFSPVGFYAGPWPPPPASNTEIIPSGTPAAPSAVAAAPTSLSGNAKPKPAGGRKK